MGHADAGFTLRTYVHLLDDDLPEPDVLGSLDRPTRDAERITAWITGGSNRPSETGRNGAGGDSAPIPLPVRDPATGPNPAEIPTRDYESAALTS